MKLAISILIISVLLGGIYIAIKHDTNTAKPNEVTNTQTENTFTTIEEAMVTGAPLLDVRTPEEFATSHIKDAVNLPLADIQSGTLPTVTKDTKIYLYCRSGNRSSQATKILKDAGFTNITDLGAMSSVIASGGTEVR